MKNNEINNQFDGLEEIQYSDLFFENEIPLNNIAGKTISWGLKIGVFIFLIILIVAIFIKIPIEQNFTFIFDASKDETIYRFNDLIHINKTMVSAGDTVVENTQLVEITSEKINDLILQYKKAKNELELFYMSDTALYSYKIDILREQIIIFDKTKDFENTILELKSNQKEDEMESRKFHFDEAERRYKLHDSLYKEGIIAEIELRDYEKDKYAEKTNNAVVEFDYEQYIAEKKKNIDIMSVKEKYTEKQINILKKEQQKREKSLINDLEYSYNRLVLNYGKFNIKDNKLILLADKKSIVTYIHDKKKEANNGDILLKLMNKKSKLYAQTSVEPAKIGYIKKGQEAVMKVATFPYYEWGVVKSEINNISITPDAQGFYPVKFKITNFGILKKQLKPGMTGKVSVLTHKKTMFELLFGKLYNIKEDFQEL